MTPAEAARHKSLILALCCLAQFMVILDVAIVNVALPSIREDLGFSATGLQWVVNAYTLAFGGFLLLGGRAADLIGQREVFAGGLLLFALASLFGGIAQTDGQLVAARAVQGLGGAVVAPATLSILMTTFTEGGERNKALGLWGAMGGVGGATGALLGGILTQTLSWRWILLINVPIGIVAALAGLRVVTRARRDVGAARSFDLSGALTVTAGLVVLTYGIVETDAHGWGSTRTLVTIALGLALLATFVVIEGRLAAAPLVPLRIFRNRPVTAANIVVFCLGAAAFAMWYFMSLYMQEVKGFDPIEAGAGVPADDGRADHHVADREPADRSRRRRRRADDRHGAAGARHARAEPRLGRRQLRGPRAWPVDRHRRRPRLRVRLGDDRGDVGHPRP